MYSFFFFQAEDGIRDDLVTGVQTCALPISRQSLIREFAMSVRRLKELKVGAGGGSTEKPLRIEKPLVLMFEEDGQTICHIHPTEGYDQRQYGLLICDLVRHLAGAFDVAEDRKS